MFFFLAFSWYRVPKNDVLFFFFNHVLWYYYMCTFKLAPIEQIITIIILPSTRSAIMNKTKTYKTTISLTFLVFSPYFRFSFLKLRYSFNFSKYDFRSDHLLSRSQTYDPVSEKTIDSRLPVPPSTFWFPYLYGKSNFKHAWILIKIWYVPVF